MSGGCLQVSTVYIPSSLSVTVGEPSSLTISISEPIQLKVTCGVVCSASAVRYLFVSPEEIQWLTDYNTIVYNVDSNTKWKII